jgi:hypothetical protein
MTLDNEDQRNFLLEVINQAQLPGVILDLAFAVKQAIAHAPIISQASGEDTIAALA